MSTTATLIERQIEQPPIDITTLSENETRELFIAETASIVSTATTLNASSLSFTAAKSFHVNAKGIPVLRLPLPPSELVTTIHNFDGSIAYQSMRECRSSGNCALTNVEGQQLMRTTYFFGLGRDPVITRLNVGGPNNTIKSVSKWTSRAQEFSLPNGRTFEWEYNRAKEFGGGEDKKGTALVLTMDGKRLAALIRNEETRTLGSKSGSAGNGGELVLGEDVGGEDGVSEDLVIATVLLMLKKEIDRRRAVQMMMISSAVSV